MKGTLAGEYFIISRDCLSVEGAVSPGSARMQNVKASGLQKNKK